METLTKDYASMCCDFKESCIFAVVKHCIEGEGHRRSHFYRQCFAWQLDIGQNWAGREVSSVLKKGLE